MANRFTKFNAQPYVSQFVPLELDLIAKIADKKQTAYDTALGKVEALKGQLNVDAPIGLENSSMEVQKEYYDKIDKLASSLMTEKNPVKTSIEMARLGQAYNSDIRVKNLETLAKENPTTMKKIEAISQGLAGGDFVDRKTGNVNQMKMDKYGRVIKGSQTYDSPSSAIYGYWEKGDWEQYAGDIVGRIKAERKQWGGDHNQEIVTLDDGKGGTKEVFRDLTTGAQTEILDETTLARAIEPYVTSLELDKGLSKVSDKSLIYRIREGVYNDANGNVDTQKVKDDLVNFGMLGQIHNRKDFDNAKNLGSINGKGNGAGGETVFNNGSAYALQTTEEVFALNSQVNDAAENQKAATVQKMWKDANGKSFFEEYETPTHIQNAIDKPETFQRLIVPNVATKIYDQRIQDLKASGIDTDNLLQSEKDNLELESSMKAQELALHFRDYQIIKKQVEDKYKRQGKNITSEQKWIPGVVGSPTMMGVGGGGTEGQFVEGNANRVSFDKDLNAAVQDFWGNKNNTSTGIQLFDDLKKSDLTTPASKEAYERDKILADALDQHSKAGDNVYYKGQKIEGFAGQMETIFEGLNKETIASLKNNPNNATFNPSMIYPKFEIKDGVPTYTMMAEGQFEIFDEDKDLGKTIKKSSKTVSVEADNIIKQQFGQDALMQLQMKAFTQKELTLMPKGSAYVINIGGEKYPVKRGQLGGYEISGDIAVQDEKGDVKVMSLAEYEKQTGVNMTKGSTKEDASQKVNDAALTLSNYRNKDLNVKSTDYGLFQINDAANTEEEQKNLPGWNKFVEPSKMTAEENLQYAAAKQAKYGWQPWSAWKYRNSPNPVTGQVSGYNDIYDEIAWIPTTDKSKFVERVSSALNLDSDLIEKVIGQFKPEKWKEALSVMMAESSGNQAAVGKNTK